MKKTILVMSLVILCGAGLRAQTVGAQSDYISKIPNTYAGTLDEQLLAAAKAGDVGYIAYLAKPKENNFAPDKFADALTVAKNQPTAREVYLRALNQIIRVSPMKQETQHYPSMGTTESGAVLASGSDVTTVYYYINGQWIESLHAALQEAKAIFNAKLTEKFGADSEKALLVKVNDAKLTTPEIIITKETQEKLDSLRNAVINKMDSVQKSTGTKQPEAQKKSGFKSAVKEAAEHNADWPVYPN